MKKIIIFCIVFSLFLTYFTSNIQALEPVDPGAPSLSPTSTPFENPKGFENAPLPGINCGISNSNTAKCCVFPPPPKAEITKQNSVFDPVFDILNGILAAVVQPAITGIYEIGTSNLNKEPCVQGFPSTPGNIENPSCICIDEKKSAITALETLCKANPTEEAACVSCIRDEGGILTGLGCIRADFKGFVEDVILRIGVGVAGGTSLLCILFAAFQMQTSGGNAEKLKKAQELLTNCITGLMVIIFSTLILKIIGADILRIPGFK